MQKYFRFTRKEVLDLVGSAEEAFASARSVFTRSASAKTSIQDREVAQLYLFSLFTFRRLKER